MRRRAWAIASCCICRIARNIVISYYAILRGNAVVVPVNPMNITAELRHIIEDCGAKVALLGEELYENARPLLGDAISMRSWHAMPIILRTAPTCRYRPC